MVWIKTTTKARCLNWRSAYARVERSRFYQRCLTYRLTLGLTVRRQSPRSWKEQCETKRWADNCLTFMLAVKLKQWTKTSSQWLGKSSVRHYTLAQRQPPRLPVCSSAAHCCLYWSHLEYLRFKENGVSSITWHRIDQPSRDMWIPALQICKHENICGYVNKIVLGLASSSAHYIILTQLTAAYFYSF